MLRTLASFASLTLAALLLGITVSTPGTVTTVVDSKLFTAPSGEQHLHGIVKDPITGDMYVGDWNAFSVGSTPFFGPYVENRDAIRRINQLSEVAVVTYAISPNAISYNAADRQMYVVVGATACSGNDARAPGATLHGIIALDPATGKAHVMTGGNAGGANGVKGEVRFSGPIGIASDPASGALFVSESCMNRIREVDLEGNATTLAGSGAQGNSDGVHVAASFDEPHGIAFCERTLYVADTGNNEIRSIALDGRVTTLAGAPQAGYLDDVGTAARFNRPTGVACDDAGNVYVADSGNNAVRKVSATGIVTTIAGNGTRGSTDGVGEAARFSTPGDITYSPADHALYVVDWDTNAIRKVAIAQ